jgi:hypothetical protein
MFVEIYFHNLLLSQELDFKKFDKNVLNCLTKGRGWFFYFLGAPMIL